MEILLLTVGFIGLVIAALTPQSTLGGLLALASFGGYFYLNSLENWVPIIIFILGICLLIFEVFVPDFGVAGIIGFLLIIGGIYLTNDNFGLALRDLSIAVVASSFLVIMLVRRGYSLAHLEKIVLRNNLDKKSGFSSNFDASGYLGKTGKTTTPLRPSGKVRFEDAELDVISTGEHIDADVVVVVTKVEGYKIIVRRVDQT
ncbi:NfeD family protein [Carnobacterium sp. ISL-102]|uniref:NfeD family protein n=1 Tax=Carnobacterium sp. ISL-102 TaxID=2819142 RepID=UPI001BE8DE23|nr:NfeD family protein [Carnobacterium sp. ISL-102]MBT2732160.1 hydrolase [Carnobacterium sp. ISL-102]